ncbi:YggT family protein [Thalassotalea ponticola]|uniref:YggT family protein n=1 Tax=Thalassotalea ponticola TaxID=1523392 RepID=UPI0025B3B328|nr:YggT family protein [Thalassotalea ponticola]MDN3652098.1 YggT family protein [Thalassotalea ponticola]
MEALLILLNFVFDTFFMLLILRVWLQAVRADFYNPLSQFVVKVTNPVVIPFRRVIPGIKGIDLATIAVAFIVAVAKLYTISSLQGSAPDIGLLLYLGLLYLVKESGYLLFVVMLIMALMSWVVQHPTPIQMVFGQLTEPFLRPIRRILPDLGGIDLSVVIAFLLLSMINAFFNTTIPYWYAL